MGLSLLFAAIFASFVFAGGALAAPGDEAGDWKVFDKPTPAGAPRYSATLAPIGIPPQGVDDDEQTPRLSIYCDARRFLVAIAWPTPLTSHEGAGAEHYALLAWSLDGRQAQTTEFFTMNQSLALPGPDGLHWLGRIKDATILSLKIADDREDHGLSFRIAGLSRIVANVSTRKCR